MITQRAAPVTLFPPTLIVSTDDDIMIDHDETGALSITFMLGGTAKGWTVTTRGDNFITLPDPSTNNLDTNEVVTIMVNPLENMGEARTDSVILTSTGDAADTVVVTQRAAPVTLDPPTLIVSTDDDIMIDHDETGALSISFRLGGTAKGWTVTTRGDNFITLPDPSTNDLDTNEVVTIMVNPLENMGEARTDSVILTSTGDAADTVVITQRAAPVTLFPPTLIVSTDDDIMIDHDETGALSISFRLGGTAKGWTVTTRGDNFITLPDPSTNNLDTNAVVTIMVNPLENMERHARIVLF